MSEESPTEEGDVWVFWLFLSSKQYAACVA